MNLLLFFSYLLVFLRNKERHELGNKYNEIINTTLQNTIIARLNRTALQESARIQCRFNMAFPAVFLLVKDEGKKRSQEVSDVAACHTCIPTTPVEGENTALDLASRDLVFIAQVIGQFCARNIGGKTMEGKLRYLG